VDEVLAVMQRLYNPAARLPVAHGYLARMAWLPDPLQRLDQSAPLDGGLT